MKTKEEIKKEIENDFDYYGGRIAFHFFQTFGFPPDIFRDEFNKKSLGGQYIFLKEWIDKLKLT